MMKVIIFFNLFQFCFPVSPFVFQYSLLLSSIHFCFPESTFVFQNPLLSSSNHIHPTPNLTNLKGPAVYYLIKPKPFNFKLCHTLIANWNQPTPSYIAGFPPKADPINRESESRRVISSKSLSKTKRCKLS